MKYRLFFLAFFMCISTNGLAAVVYDSGLYYSPSTGYVSGYNPYTGNVIFSGRTPYVGVGSYSTYYPSHYGYRYYPNYQGYYDSFGSYYTTSGRAVGSCYYNGYMTVCY